MIQMIKYNKALILGLFLSISCSFYQPIKPVNASTIAGTAAVSGIIQQIQDTISILLEQLNNHASARSFQLRMELIFLQSELANNVDELLDKTFSELTEQQQTLFENISHTINDIEGNISELEENVDLMTSKVEHILAQIPTIGEEPRLRKTEPLYINTPSDSASEISFKLSGSFMNHGEANLKFGDESCKMNGHTDTKVEFICPSTIFNKDIDKINYYSGDLVLTGEMSFLDKIGNILGGSKPIKAYKIPLTVIPNKLGTYHLIAYHEIDNKQVVPRTEAYGRTNEHCKKDQSYEYNFGPHKPGWEIDVNSIAVSRECVRRSSYQIVNLSSVGFQIKTTATNSGTCVRDPVFGSVVSWDGRGCESGKVSWTEFKNTPVPSKKVLGEGILNWGEAVSFELPERYKSFLLKVNTIDGRVINLNKSTPTRWFKVERDGTSKSIIISPSSLLDAMRR
ncbi:hypothetical protein [Photobacterium lutimaris]|uniref:Uncharacterized protein n=1 Tax=Photobacterium lutimaris TaxID=388278 RepID=A0A2T3J1Q6_9GAMM|nr:hypothetical protein [Photobacterium lutimaris]PSU34983.1 hypothetical protein C9I99_07905 [Photobacterium lutimaris]TDR77338.1 hypothetical protein DFP78_102355 [Photobacterium lutimaris]